MAEAPKPVRQSFNVAIGWLGVAIGVLLVGGGLASSGGRSMGFFGVALAVVSWCVMVRPSIRFDVDHVEVRNVIRDVILPWEGISHAKSRGSLVIHDNDGVRTTVWAIGSQKASRRHDGEDEGGYPTVSFRPMPGTLAQAPRSSGALAEALNAEAVDNPVDVPARREVHWALGPAVLMAVACVCVVLGVLI